MNLLILKFFIIYFFKLECNSEIFFLKGKIKYISLGLLGMLLIWPSKLINVFFYYIKLINSIHIKKIYVNNI